MSPQRLFLLALLVLAPSSAAAAPIIDVIPGTVTLTMVTETANPANLQGYDIRGNAILNILDPGFIGGLFLTDGTLFGNPAPAVPNAFLLGLNGTGTEGGILSTSGAAFGGPGATLFGTFTPLTPLTEPALQAFATGSPYLFGFTFLNAVPGGQVGELTVSTWALSSVTAVPEPATVALLGLGAVVAVRRIRRSAAVRG
jgi:hypothetical protein